MERVPRRFLPCDPVRTTLPSPRASWWKGWGFTENTKGREGAATIARARALGLKPWPELAEWMMGLERSWTDTRLSAARVQAMHARGRLKIGSLFSGIGGLEKGLEDSGLGYVRWQVEIDPWCREVLKKHWPHVPRFDDVSKLAAYHSRTGERIRALGPVDVLCGGFPCQDVSSAGAGAGIKEGTRSGLWIEFFRLAGELLPPVVLVENVASGAKRWVARVCEDLETLGYRARPFALSAADVGAPHQRRRVFVVAMRPDAPDALRELVRLEPGRGGGQDGAGSPEPRHDGEDGSPRALAGADGEGRGVQPEPVADEAAVAGPAGAGALGDAVRERRSRAEGRGHEGRPQPPARGDRSRRFWAPESDVGRGIDGFSAWLDGYLNAHPSEGRTAAALRSVWSAAGAEVLRREAGGEVELSAAEVLFAFVRELACRSGSVGFSLASAEASEGGLRGLRRDAEALRASRERERAGERPVESADALQLVSRLLARDAEAAWIAYRGTDACPPLDWEAGIARVIAPTKGGKEGKIRRARLRGLGNAVVPQCAEAIGKVILAILRGEEV